MVEPAELFEFALAQHGAGNLEQAEAAYRKILAEFPGHPEVRHRLAWLLNQRGQRAAAIDELRRAITDEPAVAALHHDLGVMLRQSGLLEQAIASFEAAIGLEGAMWQAHFNLASVYLELGQFELAVACYAIVVRHAPLDPEAHLNLGVAQKSLGQLDAAKASFQRALELRPGYGDAWTNLGIISKIEGNISQAIDCYRRALELNPQSAVAHYNLGVAWRAWNDVAAAIGAYQEAVRINPMYAAAYRNLGDAYQSQGSISEAIACYREALRLTGRDELKIRCALALPVILESHEQVEEVRGRLARELESLAGETLRVRDPVHGIGALAFALAYHGRNEREFQSQIAGIVRRATPELAYVAPHCAASAGPPRERRIRIGFISMHFREHTIGKLNAGLIERFDRDAFHVAVFRGAGADDAMSQRIADSADACVTLAPQLTTAQNQIAQRELDVLFYTDIGIDSVTCFLAHARLAPVQCVTWGHPLTTGVPTIDYFISGVDLEPPDSAAHYTERLVRLPHLANYYFRPQPSPSTKTRCDFGLSDEAHVYACLQSLFKFHPDDDAVFAQILRRDPQGVLLLLEGQFPNWTALLRTRFRDSMSDVIGRIQFVPQQPPPDFSRLLAEADVLLDPLHFGGGDTSYQSFAVGTPIVTLPGGFLRSRITYALYRAMGISDCIAASVEDYVEVAVRLGTDRQRRDCVRDKILSANHAIYENDAGVRELENFLIEAVGRQ